MAVMKKDLTLSSKVENLLMDISEGQVDITEAIAGEAEILERPGIIHKAAAYYIQGLSAKDIAAELGASPTSVRVLFRKQAFKDIVKDMSLEVVAAAKTIVRSNTLKAAEVLGSLLDSEDEKIKKSAADSILDRAGVKGADKVEVTTKINNLNVLTDEEVLLRYMRELQEYKPPKNVEGVEYDVTDEQSGD